MLLHIIIFYCILVVHFITFASASDVSSSCNKDLDSIYFALHSHSAPAKNQADVSFHRWLQIGYKQAKDSCAKVREVNDIFTILKNFTDGFNDSHISLQQREAYTQPILNKVNAKFDISYFNKGVWIKIPTFSPNKEEAVALSKIFCLLPKLRNKKFVVFDLRGNTGGSTNWERSLIRNFWGDNYLRSLGNKHSYNQEWSKKLRISPENFTNFSKSHDPQANQEYQNLMKQKKDFYIENWNIYEEQANLYSNQDNIPVTAQIFVLTDNACNSTCWLCVRELLEIPEVVHIGHATGVQTLYSQTRPITLPSSNFTFYCPTQQRMAPIHHVGAPFIPTIQYASDLTDETKLKQWFISQVLKD